ncbi:hypothetical protein DE146DRAFT_790354 [Phaeosphaeria sp. MPI-PUGE-AT-0046c]|nr:hypothetical protein DE146DRAFT_790354 [Phaeosphaeria sp. MPI-PUGE-AT-0046c]
MADTRNDPDEVPEADAVVKDYLLVVGPDTVEIHVNSVFLSAASKPFRAIFAPKWRAGHEVKTTNGVVTIPLPEDDGVALQVICAVIQHENHTILNNLPAHTILRIAIMADKYDCYHALRYASESWLNPAKDVVDDLSILTAAAYLFRNATAFRQLTKKMILMYKGSFAAAAWGGAETLLDWRLLGLLEGARSAARLQLATILIRGVGTEYRSCVHRCGWSSKYAFAYIQQLNKNNLGPEALIHQSIADAIAQAEYMPDPIPDEDSGTCQYAYKHRVPGYRKDREWPLEHFKNNLGLCLPCVRAGDGNAANCQEPHKDRN